MVPRSPIPQFCVPPAALLLACFCLFTLLLAPGAAGQNSDPVHVVPLEKRRNAPEQTLPPGALSLHERPLRVDVDMVLVPVTVTDVMNRPVTDLAKDRFQLYEGEEPQDIEYFAKEDAPISIGVLLDLSNSMKDKMDTVRRALKEFFKTANPDDDYFVVTFSDSPELLADSTRSVGYIQGKLADATAGGHTALLDAIYLGLHKLRAAQYKRRALVIISDGGDNRSRYKAKEIKSMVEEADVQIYAMGIFDTIFRTPEEWAGKRLLTTITEATGGRTLTIGNIRELPGIATTISWELRNQYVLGYRSSNPARDGKWRKIRVQVTPSASSTPVQLHYKRGYQAAEK